jgi:hypothetical protein
MSAVAYPTSLPGPSRWAAVPLERRAVSSLPGATALRGRSRDAVHDIEAEWRYSATEMATWRVWYEDSLLDGQRWFAATAPGAGGWLGRVLRYRPRTLRREALGNGNFRVSAQLQQRSALAVAPSVVDLPWSFAVTDEFKYLVVPHDDSADYSAEGFDDSGWVTANGAFGSGAVGAAGYPAPTTVIGIDKKIWLRKHETLPQIGELTFDMGHDNGVELWVNGVAVTTSAVEPFISTATHTPASTRIVVALAVTNFFGVGWIPENPIYAGISGTNGI